jgi:3-(3-hydroxy-phenyl)propionate hydroxylase
LDALAAHYPVIIVGAGPTGLTLANLLGRYRVRFLLVERNPTTVQEPRAVSIDDESLRTLQAAGVIETVLPDIVPGYGSLYYTARRICFAKVEPTGRPYGYPRRNAFRQPKLEAQLRAALVHAAEGSTLFGWQLEQFTQEDERVELLLRGSSGGRRTVSCDYLVGCDGAASTVRTELDIVLEGTTYAKRWLIVDLENNRNTTRHTEVFCNRRRPCITLPGPDRTRRYEFEMFSDETDAQMLAPEHVRALLAAHDADPDAAIRRTAVYRFHARVAPRWQVERVLLAGDAAHLTPPFAGQGMNSGLRDAHNLAWKLAVVASGKIGPAVLRTYEQERRDHVWQMIQLALRMGHVMSPPSRWSAILTQAGFLMLHLWPPARDYVTQMKYKPQPRFTSGFMIPDGRGNRRTLVGRLLPQPKVIAVSGRRMLLDDVLGPRFALLIRAADAEQALAALDQPIWDELGAVLAVVLPAGTEPFVSERGVTMSECDDGFASALGPDRNNVILLRPDRYVAACFPLEKAASAARAVEALLADTWEESPVTA